MLKNILSVFIITTVFCFAENILPAQTDAIKTLASENGFSNGSLDEYLIKHYGTTIYGLTRIQAVQIINRFQSDNPPKPLLNTYIKEEIQAELLIAESLEVGMSKRFYMIDGNVIDGTITSIEEGICSIQTIDGKLKIPINEILEETVDLLKKDGTRYKGPVIHETLEELVIKSKYGEVTVLKKNIKDLDRYQGGRLVPKTEVTKKFYQGEAQLITVFLDPTGFPLEANAFYMSGLSVGYGFTERFMITTKFASNFAGDLNLHPKLRVFHQKTADTEQSLSLGIGLHRNFPKASILSKYSHYVNITRDGDLIGTLNEEGFNYSDGDNSYDIEEASDIIGSKGVYAEAYIVYTSRRKNPTGRGKVGWTLGAKITNSFILLDDLNEIYPSEGDDYIFTWSEDRGKIPFRTWASFEYDLRKNLKFVGSTWMDNGNKSKTFGEVVSDFTGDTSENGGSSFILDSPNGKFTQFDFDFGFIYAVNDNFRVGVHFQQPYIDIYWKFFEF
ncbi:MAG: hypothetical protein CMF96_09915 [Candidatus Marinimicrobia bacterium]|nr:hypothetical protein [Candidatus Neomarinimicrobiota bacterium]